ncbi:MAG: DoxX family protein [Cyclobacteriaceae bacterium]|nr:MAG: DoxX family protein [Cyclobacteriaceae bacterium]HNT51730.1 DoxX family protein [Cyclobacteriaceae bacterium]
MKKDKIIFWSITLLVFLWEGVMPLGTLIFSLENFNAGTKPLGYPDYFAYLLIMCKIVGATAIMLPMVSPKVREWAYAGLTFNLLFATFSHAVVDGNAGFISLPLVILGLLTISYRFKARLFAQG